MAHTGLAVLESRWWKQGNDSVRPLFALLAGLHSGNPHHFRYDMFAERESLACLIGDIAADPRLRALYISAHGEAEAIHGAGVSTITAAELSGIIAGVNEGGRIAGLYLGACLITTPSNVACWLDPGTGLTWVAGYSKSVDWVESAAVDMLFWSKLFAARRRNARAKVRLDEADLVRGVATKVRALMPAIGRQLGYNIYLRGDDGAIDALF